MATEIKHLKNELALSRAEYDGLIGNYFDIFSNLEKMVEERTRELHRIKSLLETKGRELEIMLDASPALIFFKDPQGRYLRVNQRFAQTLQIPMDQIIGKTHGEMFTDCAAPVLADDSDVIDTGRPTLLRYARIQTPEGLRSMVVDKIPYMDDRNQVAGIIGFATDMTDQEKAQREKLELQERLSRSQKMESLGLLAGGVAHDLNNVLTGMVSYPEYLLMEIPADSPLREPLRVIQQSGQKAAAIVQDLLTLARRGVTHTEVLNLNDIISGYLHSPEHTRLQKEYADVRVNTRLEPRLLNIRGSAVHLRKTIMNLVANAFEAHTGSGLIHLLTENRHIDRPVQGYDHMGEGDYAVFQISDQGTGIAAEDLNRIFEPFYTKKVMGRSGTGLGMAVVWGTVQDHKGCIHVQSREGIGSTFTLLFPVTREALRTKAGPLPLQAFMGRGETILVVDDIAEQREIAATILGRLNYRVTTAATCAEAVDHTRRHSPDLVVLDMIMEPGPDGLDTYRRILQIQPHQRAIIASGYSETERVREAQRLGAGTYVRKPYLIEKLGLAVRQELDRAPGGLRLQSPVETACAMPSESPPSTPTSD
jgi:two-component system cell cycle sensor histidine kinase/response regulator CckA